MGAFASAARRTQRSEVRLPAFRRGYLNQHTPPYFPPASEWHVELPRLSLLVFAVGRVRSPAVVAPTVGRFRSVPRLYAVATGTVPAALRDRPGAAPLPRWGGRAR